MPRRVSKGLALASVSAAIVRLLRPVITIRLVRFHSAFGNVLRGPFYYLLQRERERASGHPPVLDIAFWIGESPNARLASIWNRKILIVGRRIGTAGRSFLNVISWYWKRDPRMESHVLEFVLPQQMCAENMNTPTYSARKFLRKAEFEEVHECLLSLGVRQESPIALIHVRNSCHDLATSESYNGRCHDADPPKFQKAVDFLLDLGYSVLTFGNSPESPSGLHGVINYHSSRFRSPRLDFTLGSVASFYIGTTAGAPSSVAFNFRIPALLTNHPIWNSNVAAEPLSYGRAVLLPKNTRDMTSMLTHSECLSRNLPSGDRELSRIGVTLEDNDADDILIGLHELFDLEQGKSSWDDVRLSPDQKSFYSVFDSHAKLSRVCKSTSAVISPNFLQKFPHWLQ